MRVLMINSVCGIRSTGRICTDLAAALEADGHEVKIAYGRETAPEAAARFAVRIGTDTGVRLHALRARLSDSSGFGSTSATKRFVEWIEDYAPDVIHLHNLHGYYLDLELLFRALRGYGRPIIWTLHDCWAFTGHAAYCEAADCERWESGCFACPKRSDYPKSLVDHSRENWLRKKELFTSVPSLALVTPSEWLAGLVGRSFLREYPVSVIRNGVDTGVFRPVRSEVKKRLGIEGKKMILGVAAVWDARKGLDDCIALSALLGEDCRVVLVGLNEQQLRALPASVLGIRRTDSAQGLAELYSAADYFINPTYEDNYPTTNLEAISCGTPVLSYDTGGSPESARLYGTAVPKGDVAALAELIRSGASFERLPCDLDVSAAIGRYLSLYRSFSETR